MERVVLGLFRLGIAIGIFAWAIAATDLTRSLHVFVDGALAGWAP